VNFFLLFFPPPKFFRAMKLRFPPPGWGAPSSRGLVSGQLTANSQSTRVPLGDSPTFSSCLLLSGCKLEAEFYMKKSSPSALFFAGLTTFTNGVYRFSPVCFALFTPPSPSFFDQIVFSPHCLSACWNPHGIVLSLPVPNILPSSFFFFFFPFFFFFAFLRSHSMTSSQLVSA